MQIRDFHRTEQVNSATVISAHIDTDYQVAGRVDKVVVCVHLDSHLNLIHRLRDNQRGLRDVRGGQRGVNGIADLHPECHRPKDQ